ncbi:LOW QUALITY PROTEIN: hypothetical protein Cgig2_013311 [Carnegiea gigantea]|uniref:Disease resistance R13L4/SHOC-2-like LRR domain-containing protein n=1 Tax=Carnegiea gigantea TaxID=171969 RepID=A0A9Q1JJX5_9CARY|nr:LOW QUALITY PROTEIN: hypothetical protein Cgig2_013311 [Carnegiea gigantea]
MTTRSPLHVVFSSRPFISDSPWLLFCLRTFGNRDCPAELEEFGHEMVAHGKVCLLQLGQLPSFWQLNKKTLSEWYKLKNCSASELGRYPIEGQRSCAYELLKGFGILSNGDNLSVNREFRRLLIQDRCNNEYVSEVISTIDLKTLDNRLASSMLRATTHLRVLDLQGAKIWYVPPDAVKTGSKELPESMGQLHNLETLDLKWCHVFYPPKGCSSNTSANLRYFLAGEFIDLGTDFILIQTGITIPENALGSLEGLQTLAYEQGLSINELQSLKKLRLGIVKLRTENGNGNALCYAVEKMKHLRSLKVRSAEENEILDLQHIISPPPLLQKRYFSGRLKKIPDWIRKLNNLVKLSLI